jgi:hypothetical protein
MTANLGCLKNGVARHGALRSFCSASMVSNSRRRVELPLPQHLLGHRRPLCRRGHDWQATPPSRKTLAAEPFSIIFSESVPRPQRSPVCLGALCLGIAFVVKSRIVSEAIVLLEEPRDQPRRTWLGRSDVKSSACSWRMANQSSSRILLALTRLKSPDHDWRVVHRGGTVVAREGLESSLASCRRCPGGAQ